MTSQVVSPPTGPVAEAFAQHRRFLWGLAYRLTGTAYDADDLVQETFVRALARPPKDQTLDWRPWLTRVCVNLGRDLLRRRRRRGYEGTWLPQPIETDDEPPSYEPPSPGAGNPMARFDLIESVSLAFLLALEALSPMQRAVLVLRDVFDYSAQETAAALGISEVNVRTTHLRARRALRAYEHERVKGRSGSEGEARRVLEQFLSCLSSGDVAGVEALLAPEARALSDAGGEFHANVRPVIGPANVAAAFLGLARKSAPVMRLEWTTVNGQPAVLVERQTRPGFAARFLMTADLDAEGRIRCLYSVLASTKLAAVGRSAWDEPPTEVGER